MARLLAITIEQERQQKEAGAARNDRKDDKQPEIVPGKARRDCDNLVGDRREPLEQNDPGAPLRISGAKGLDLVAIAVEMNEPGAERVIQQRADRIAENAAGNRGKRA